MHIHICTIIIVIIAIKWTFILHKSQCLSLWKHFYTHLVFCQMLLLLMSEHFLLLFDTWEFGIHCSVAFITCCSVWFWCLHVSWHSKLLRLLSSLVKRLVCDTSVFMAVLPRDLRSVTLKEASIVLCFVIMHILLVRILFRVCSFV